MTTFTDRARAEAERRWPSYPTVGFSGADDRQAAFTDGAEWAASQEPTAAVAAMARAMATYECKGKPWEELHENVREVYLALAGVAATALTQDTP